MLKNLQISLGRLTYSVSQGSSSFLCQTSRLPCHCAQTFRKGYSTQNISKPLGHKGLEELKKKRSPLTNVQVDFFYDTISPYSWYAFEVLQRYKQQWNLNITYKPIFLAGLTKLVSNNFLQSLTENPNKAKYMFQDIERSGKFFRVPIRMPESPFYLLGVVGSLKQQRFLTAVKLNHDRNVVEEVSRGLWYRVWSEDMDCAKSASFMVVGRRAGLSEEEVNKCIEEMNNDSVKNELIRTTEEAKEEGAYGMPYLVVHRDKTESNSFFGSDRFEVIADYIGHTWDGPVPRSLTDFVPLEMAPDPANGDINEQLLKMGATTINKEIS